MIVLYHNEAGATRLGYELWRDERGSMLDTFVFARESTIYGRAETHALAVPIARAHREARCDACRRIDDYWAAMKSGGVR